MILKWYENVCVCVYVCGQNEVEVCTTLAYPRISSFHTEPVLYTSTCTHASSNHLRIVNRRGKKCILPKILSSPFFQESSSQCRICQHGDWAFAVWWCVQPDIGLPSAWAPINSTGNTGIHVVCHPLLWARHSPEPAGQDERDCGQTLPRQLGKLDLFFFVCVCVCQTCLVYAVGVENYTFEAQTTHLHLHYTIYANDFFRLRDSDKCDAVLFFDAILFLTWPPCSRGMWARLWYVRIKSCNSDAGFGADIGSEHSQNSLQLGEIFWVKEASVWNFFRRRLGVSLQRLCYCG